MHYRVFVSHVNDDPETDAALAALCLELEQAEMDVLLDRTCLAPGAIWRQEIYGWLGLCHAAVVLISRRAIDDLEKPWVARETSLLIWRQALDPTLLIIPVLLPGVESEDLTNGRFADLQLREIQCIRGGADPKHTAADVINALKTASKVSRVTPLDAVGRQIAARLRGLDVGDLVEAAALVGADLGRWRPAGDHALDLGLSLLCAPFDKAAAAIEYLANFATASVRINLREVAHLLAANWVDPEAARWIAHDAIKGHPLVLNASTQFAAEAYVQRACGMPPATRWPLVPVTGVTGESAAEEIQAEVEAALALAIPLTKDAFGASPSVRRKRVLQLRHSEGRPVFLLARLPSNPQLILRGLRLACPLAAPFFLAGDLTEAEADELGISFRVLRPLLDPHVDLIAQTRLDDLLARLVA